MRSLSASSLTNNSRSTTRVPSASSSYDPSDSEYTPRTSHDFYGTANHSVDSLLRDDLTSFAASDGIVGPGNGRLLSGSWTGRNGYASESQPAHSRSQSSAPSTRNSVSLRSLNHKSHGSSPANAVPKNEEDGKETLLWAFAQFSGSFTIEEGLMKSGEYIAVKRSLFGGGKGSMNGRGGVDEGIVGGGSLDTETLNKAPSDSRGGWTSWLWGASSNTAGPSLPDYLPNHRSLAGASDSSGLLTEKDGNDQDRQRTSTATLVPQVASTAPVMGSLEERRNRMMNDTSVPVFNSPPSILAVDLVLEPGDKRSCTSIASFEWCRADVQAPPKDTFTLRLPGDLPPSFRGKAISFTYNFMVGTNRVSENGRGEYTQQSRLVRVPVRMYNHVSGMHITIKM